jgi:hypothetical protein
MNSSQSQISIPVLLGDTGREWHINLSDGGKPYIITDGCLAKLSIKRPTGTRLEEFCTIVDNTTIVYKFTQNENTCAVEGIHECDVTLYGLDGKVIATARFTMVVSERAINSDDIVLTDEDFTAVDAMLKAEASRQVAESNRVEAEVERSEAEAERVANEEERKENAMLFKESVEQAVEAKAASKASAESAKASETNAKTSETKATNASNVATAQAQSAIESASASASSATEAKGYMEVAQGIANDSVNMDSRITRNSKRITNLEQGLPSEQFMTDSTVAHVKDVPMNALPFAEVSKVGGMTRKCTNLIPNTYTTRTISGVTFTVNSDGSITANGTATATIYFKIAVFSTTVGNTYYLSGCPSGGSWSKYLLYADASKPDTGSGVLFTTTNTESSVTLFIASDVTVSNITFYPMVNSGDTALPYEPYYEGLRDAKVTEIESVGKNFAVSTENHSQTNFGITITRIIGASFAVANGTLTGSYALRLFGYFKLPAGTYTASVFNINPTDRIYVGKGSNILVNYIQLNSPKTFTLTEEAECFIQIVFEKGSVYNNTEIQVQIERGDTATEYSPYTRNSLPIPEAVRNLDGYGEGNPDNAEEYNAIINKDGKWKYSHKGNIENNLWLPLATPEITDISDLLSADNFLAVEGGGTVTAVNENGLEAPSEITYMLKETTV